MAITKITGGGITADVIDGTKIADNAVDTEHLADDAVDSAEIAAGAIDAAHMSVNSIDSDSYVDGSIDNAHLADDAVGVAELSATGTASSSTFLRGDNSWTAVSTPITALNNATESELVTVGSTTTELDAESGLTFDGSNLTLTSSDIVFATAGKGICLGVTSNTDSNTLDDYEEGTFTLAMHSGWSGTISTTTSTYTKIGRNVTVNFRGNLNDAEGNSSVRVSGFPFSLPNINVQVTAYYSQQQSVGLWISQGGYFYYQNTTVGGNNQGENAAWLDSATGVAFNVTYITT